jgi:hypothetical protein
MTITKALTSIVLFVAAIAPLTHAVCNNATAAGSFGFTTAGNVVLPSGFVPFGAVGLVSFDVNGNATGSEDRSLAGAFEHETLAGTLTVNRDCSLVSELNVFDNSGNLVRTSKLTGVISVDGKHIRAIFESILLPNGATLASVLTVDATLIRGSSDR